MVQKVSDSVAKLAELGLVRGNEIHVPDADAHRRFGQLWGAFGNDLVAAKTAERR